MTTSTILSDHLTDPPVIVVLAILSLAFFAIGWAASGLFQAMHIRRVERETWRKAEHFYRLRSEQEQTHNG